MKNLRYLSGCHPQLQSLPPDSIPSASFSLSCLPKLSTTTFLISYCGNTVRIKSLTSAISSLPSYPRTKVNVSLNSCSDILRRVMLFDRLKLDLAQQQAQIPKKYIKFGQNTQYIFHSSQNNVEQSNIYLTSIFESYMNIKTINSKTFSQVLQNISQIIKQFKQYKKIENKKQLPILLDRAHLLKYKDVNKEQIYNLSKQIQLRIRRFLEIAKYIKQGKAYMSGFTFTDLLHMNKHYDLLAPHKYNFDSNTPDIILLYGTAITYGIFKFIIKRAVKM